MSICYLFESGCVRGKLFLYFSVGIGNLFWSINVVQVLIGYCKIFGKVIDGNGVVFDVFESVDVDVFIGKVDVFIDFIRDDVDIILFGNDIGNSLQFWFGVNGIGRVIWGREQQDLSMFGKCILDLVCCYFVILFDIGVY